MRWLELELKLVRLEIDLVLELTLQLPCDKSTVMNLQCDKINGKQIHIFL